MKVSELIRQLRQLVLEHPEASEAEVELYIPDFCGRVSVLEVKYATDHVVEICQDDQLP